MYTEGCDLVFMVRLAVEYLSEGMELARDIYDLDGRVILVQGAILSNRHIEILKRWNITSVYVSNPLIELPRVDELLEEKTRHKAIKIIKKSFEQFTKDSRYILTGEQQEVIKSVVDAVMKKRQTILHLSQINRHHDDLFTHSLNVAMLSAVTAVAVGTQDKDELKVLVLGALLHDLGKLIIPKHILNKVGPLSIEEKEIFQSHTKCGFEILRKDPQIPLFAAHIAFQHHEQFDGKGYPRQLAGSSILPFARIVSIANEYDNLIADKPGQPGLKMHVAYETIVSGVNRLFEPEAAKSFLSRIALYPVGTMVKVTTGHTGVVVAVTPRMQHRPIIKILTDQTGEFLHEPEVMDLAALDNLTVFIQETLDDAIIAEIMGKRRVRPGLR
jgi:putative nucleotidyltransferase with HDIG domain